jgi:hypothetical protein
LLIGVFGVVGVLGVERVLTILPRLLVEERVLMILALLVGVLGDLTGDFGVLGVVGVFAGDLDGKVVGVVDAFTGDSAGNFPVVRVSGVFGDFVGLLTDFTLLTLPFLLGVLGFSVLGRVEIALARLDLLSGEGVFLNRICLVRGEFRFPIAREDF